jgi:hypothetical protein
MPKSRARRLHIAIDPQVEMTLGEHRVAFDGLNLLHGVVMVEYSVTPPLEVDSPFGPHLRRGSQRRHKRRALRDLLAGLSLDTHRSRSYDHALAATAVA